MWTICPHWFRQRQFTSCGQNVYMRWAITQKILLGNDALCHSPHQLAILTSWYWVRRSPCMAFLPPSGGVFRLSLAGSSPGIPCRRSCGFQGAVLDLAIKKSPHNNLNLTIPSGMALVRVRYVAIRKLKTCSDFCESRAWTLSKYVILNCWDRLPQKLSRVNKKFWKYDTFGSLSEKARETLVKRANRTTRSVCNGMPTRNFFEQKNNRPLQVELENGRSFLQSDFQIWEAFWKAS